MRRLFLSLFWWIWALVLNLSFAFLWSDYDTVAINPNGRNYASGAEDGYVRLHFFDKSYLDMKDPVPEAEESTDDDAEDANAE